LPHLQIDQQEQNVPITNLQLETY